jgi:hypothetical protein
MVILKMSLNIFILPKLIKNCFPFWSNLLKKLTGASDFEMGLSKGHPSLCLIIRLRRSSRTVGLKTEWIFLSIALWRLERAFEVAALESERRPLAARIVARGASLGNFHN